MESLPPRHTTAAPGATGEQDSNRTLPASVPRTIAWPSPPLGVYLAARPQDGPPKGRGATATAFDAPGASADAAADAAAPSCVVKDTDGRIIRGRLRGFDPASRMALVELLDGSGTGKLVAWPMAAIRTLMLSEPLQPAPLDGDPSPSNMAAMLAKLPRSDYKVTLNGGTALRGVTLGHVELDCGLFLFPPIEDSAAVLRLFIAREVIAEHRIGPRIGELLTDQPGLAPALIDQAVSEQSELRAQKIGDLLVQQQVVTPEQLAAALQMQARMPVVRVGDALRSLGLISAAQLQAALDVQRNHRAMPLGELLVQQKAITREDLRHALARKMGYPVVDITRFKPDPQAVAKVPVAMARRLRVLPLALHGGQLVVALDDPAHRRIAIDELEFVCQCRVVPTLCEGGEIDSALALAYGITLMPNARQGSAAASGSAASGAPSTAPASAHNGGIEGGATDDETGRLIQSLERDVAAAEAAAEDEPVEQSDNALVRLINQMIIEAYNDGVSDIHIECQGGNGKVRIRFRRDGRLRNYQELPPSYRNPIVARIKIMCDLDISERRKPQDGKINFSRFSPQYKLELRVATIPTANGLEDVVLRLLASAKPIALDQLGLSPRNLTALREVIGRPYGCVLCVGPTGSGKTTTLHSALGHINRPERKIWTAEDPVEITQAGLRQVQVNAKIDWTFARALRAFLRADPDVIMVGEVRDQETAQMVVEASLTGHLVLSTLHTNTAPETVTRLLDMGLDPFNFADALLAVLAQRLVGKLCPKCRTERAATDDEVQELLADYCGGNAGETAPKLVPAQVQADWLQRFAGDGTLMHYESPGCGHCDGTGLRGRVGIHELMNVGQEQRRLIQRRGSVEDLQASALRDGMRTLRQDGIEKVLQGLTSIGEVRATSNA